MIGVAGRDSIDAMADFVARHGLDGVPHLVDADGSLWARFEVVAQPAWVFVDDDGTARRVQGSLDEDGLRAELQALASG